MKMAWGGLCFSSTLHEASLEPTWLRRKASSVSPPSHAGRTQGRAHRTDCASRGFSEDRHSNKASNRNRSSHTASPCRDVRCAFRTSSRQAEAQPLHALHLVSPRQVLGTKSGSTLESWDLRDVDRLGSDVARNHSMPVSMRLARPTPRRRTMPRAPVA